MAKKLGRPRKEGGSVTSEGYVRSGTEDQEQYLHRQIMRKAFPEDEWNCEWCTQPVFWSASDKYRLIVDHRDHDRSHNVLSNLVISCQKCNIRRRPGVDIVPGEWKDDSEG